MCRAKNKTDDTKENKKPLWKKVFLGFAFIDAIVGIIFLICYLKGCLPFNNKPNTSPSISSSIDNTNYAELDEKFKQLVAIQMEYDGFTGQHIEEVVAVTYDEVPHSYFNINIVVATDSHLVNLSIGGIQYKEGNDTLVSYLLCNNEIEGSTNLYTQELVGVVERTQYGKSATSISASGFYYQTGYQKEGNQFVIKYFDSPEAGLGETRRIWPDQPLYNYYCYLNFLNSNS